MNLKTRCLTFNTENVQHFLQFWIYHEKHDGVLGPGPEKKNKAKLQE